MTKFDRKVTFGMLALASACLTVIFVLEARRK